MGIAIKDRILKSAGRAAAKPAPKPAVRLKLAVDFPAQNEKIISDEYTFRVDAPLDCAAVEIAVDQGPWRPCRSASGYWWHDWFGYDDGEHEIAARLTTAEGTTVTSEPHEFFVERLKVAA